MFCTNCGNEISDDSVICSFCGASVSGGETGEKKSKLLPILMIVAGVLFAAALVLMAIKVIPAIFGGNKKAEFKGVYYLKDNELCFSNFSGRKSAKIGKDIYDHWSDSNEYYVARLQLSDDGKYVFYQTDYDSDEYKYDVYRSKADGKGTPVKMASDVYMYNVLGSDKLLYQDDEGSLYLVDGEEKERVSKDVSYYMVDENEKYVVWVDDDANLYVRELGLNKEKEKIDKEVYELYGLSANADTILYSKEDQNDDGMWVYDIYQVDHMKDPEPVVRNVQDYEAYLVDGKPVVMYLVEQGRSDLTMMDLIEDDYPGDENLREPDIYDYTTYTTIDGFFGTTTREEVDDKYYDDLQEYRAKEMRDQIREAYKDQSLDIYECELRCYNNGEDSQIEKGAIEVEDDFQTDDRVLVQYELYDLDKIPKVKLSEIWDHVMNEGDSDWFDDKFSNSFSDIAHVMISDGSDTAEISLDDFEEDGFDVEFFTSGENVYLCVEAYDSYSSDLYSMNLESSNFGETEKIASDVDYIFDTLDGHIFYLTDLSSDKTEGTLYCDKDKVDTDVSARYAFSGYDDYKGYYYYKDYDQNSECGDLYYYENGKKDRVAKEVHSLYRYTEKYTALLMEYDTGNHEGVLAVYDGKDCDKIAKDVNSIIYR